MLDLNLKECDILPLIPIIKASGYSIINLSTKKYVDLIVCDPRLEEKIQIILICDNGAGEGIRTLDIHLGKVVLYQLSYARETTNNRYLFKKLKKIICLQFKN